MVRYQKKNFSDLEMRYVKRKYLILTGFHPAPSLRVRINRLRFAKKKNKLGVFYYRDDGSYSHTNIRDIPKLERKIKRETRRRKAARKKTRKNKN